MTGGKYPSLFTLHERHHVLLSVGCKARQAEKMAAVLVMLVHGRWLFIPAQKIAVMPLPLSGMHSVLTADLIFYQLHYPSVLLFYHSVCHFEQIIKFYKKNYWKIVVTLQWSRQLMLWLRVCYHLSGKSEDLASWGNLTAVRDLSVKKFDRRL